MQHNIRLLRLDRTQAIQETNYFRTDRHQSDTDVIRRWITGVPICVFVQHMYKECRPTIH